MKVMTSAILGGYSDDKTRVSYLQKLLLANWDKAQKNGFYSYPRFYSEYDSVQLIAVGESIYDKLRACKEKRFSLSCLVFHVQ